MICSERGIALRILNLGIDTGHLRDGWCIRSSLRLAEMERELLIERTNSGLAASRARGRKGGRKREFSRAAARKAQEQTTKVSCSVTEIARLAGISRQTLYRYLNVDGDRDPVQQADVPNHDPQSSCIAVRSSRWSWSRTGSCHRPNLALISGHADNIRDRSRVADGTDWSRSTR